MEQNSTVREKRGRERELKAKGLADRGIGLFLLFVLSPFLALMALLIWIAQGSPIFFLQMRSGLGGRPFQIVKFRTMDDRKDASGRALADEMRLTAAGRLLRATSLDELPTLWNVICGELSLVGPRPLVVRYLGRYSREQARRHSLMPGITGWAQIHGRNRLSWEQKFALDLWYVDHWNLGLDCRILAMTIWRVLRQDGISSLGQATSEEFMGSGSRGGAKGANE